MCVALVPSDTHKSPGLMSPQARILEYSPTGPLDSDSGHRGNHRMCVLNLEHIYKDWVFSVIDAYAVDSMYSCIQGHDGQQGTLTDCLVREWKALQVGQD